MEDIKRGLSSHGDGWDIAIGSARILADGGEVASTALGAAGAAEKGIQTAHVALIKREIKVVMSQRAAAGLSVSQMASLSESLGELSAKKEFLAAGYSRPISVREPLKTLKTGAGNLKRVPQNGGTVRQGVDQGYRSVQPFRSVVVEAKGLSRPPGQANQAKVLAEDTRGLVEGSADWNLDRLQSAAESGSKNAEDFLNRLDGEAPQSFLSVTNTGSGETIISRLQGASGRPDALVSGLDNVSPVTEMVGTAAVDVAVRNIELSP